MILQANIHFEERGIERMISCSCRNGKELLDALTKKQAQQSLILLDNTFQKVFSIKEEFILLKENVEEICNIIYHITCQKQYNAITFILVDKQPKINCLEGKQLYEDFMQYQKQQQHGEKNKGGQPISKMEYEDSHKKISELIRKDHQVLQIFKQQQFCDYFIKLQNFVSKIQVQITEFQLCNAINLQWPGVSAAISSNDEPNSQGSLAPKNHKFQVKNEKIEYSILLSKTTEGGRFQSKISFNLNCQHSKDLIFVFNKQIIAFQFPLTIVKKELQ